MTYCNMNASFPQFHSPRRMFILTLLVMTMLQMAQAQRHEIFNSRIMSLQVVAGNRWMQMPVAELGGEPIHISFDDMTHDYHRYTYRIEHCDADWSVSEGLFLSDYMSGFDGLETIDDYEESVNTNHLYTHYRLSLPNGSCRFRMSGNYKLTVYDDDTEEPMFTACFMVVEPRFRVGLEVTTNTDIDIHHAHQQVAMRLDYGDVHVSDHQRQLKTVVLQNGRWDNAVFDAKPNFVRMDGLQWAHNRALIFDAGNVYRKFEMLDMNHTTMGLDALHWDGSEYHAHVMPDTPRPSYVYDESAQGAFYIRNSDNVDNDCVSDYAMVHFQLYADRQDGDVYLNGAWTQDAFLPPYLMTYDEAARCYNGSVLLKQGYYSYQYLVLHADGSTSPVTTEGNFYQTANRYQALVYYRGTTDRADQLLGYQELSMKNVELNGR